jgi:hypothetical protein
VALQPGTKHIERMTSSNAGNALMHGRRTSVIAEQMAAKWFQFRAVFVQEFLCRLAATLAAASFAEGWFRKPSSVTDLVAMFAAGYTGVLVQSTTFVSIAPRFVLVSVLDGRTPDNAKTGNIVKRCCRRNRSVRLFLSCLGKILDRCLVRFLVSYRECAIFAV